MRFVLIYLLLWIREWHVCMPSVFGAVIYDDGMLSCGADVSRAMHLCYMGPYLGVPPPANSVQPQSIFLRPVYVG